MTWSRSDLDWVAARLLPDWRDIAAQSQNRQFRITARLHSLYRELAGPMKIRITEPVFFQGRQRVVGEMMDVEVGPYRSEIVPGGLTRIPQFAEMAEEIIQSAPAPALEQSPVKPVIVPEPTPSVRVSPPLKTNSLAARVRGLTARRSKFFDTAAAILDVGEENMSKIEADGPAILQRSVDASHDELTAIADLEDALKQMGNGPF